MDRELAGSHWLVKLGLAVAAFIFAAAVAVADCVTNYETAVSLLYLVPIVLAAWSSWRVVAVLISVLSGVSDVITSYIAQQAYTPITVLNAVIQSVFFVAFTFVLLALKGAVSNLKRMSRTDSLTGLANSRSFFETGNIEIHRSLRYQRPFSVVYIDIDNFKIINDELGHSAGNTFLCKISEGVKKTLRATDTTARLGGDEFAMLFPETDSEAAQVVLTRVRDVFTETTMPDGKPVTFSAGIVTVEGHACTFDDVIKAADAMMYEVKRSGKNATLCRTLSGESQ